MRITMHLANSNDFSQEAVALCLTRDKAQTRFLDWREVPETIAVLPELTLGGVQIDLSEALAGKSQSLQYGDMTTANDSMWRVPA